MTSFIAMLDPDTNHEVQYIMKEVKKRLGFKSYPKTECVRDIMKVVMQDKDDILLKLLKHKNSKEINLN